MPAAMHSDSLLSDEVGVSAVADRVATPNVVVQGPSTEDLLNGLRKCLPVLPILATQLQEVSRTVEQAVVEVCSSFMDIAERARQTAEQVSLISNGSRKAAAEGNVGVNDLVSNTRGILGTLLRRIEQTNEFSGVAVARMQTMEGQITSMTEMLSEIEGVTADARFLALNGQLEAARAGVHGAAFSIVARETAKMADQAGSSSKTARELVGEIAQSIGTTSEELHKRALADTRDAARSRDEVNRSLDSMASLHDEMDEVLKLSEQNSTQLARDIATAVRTLQFQDAVSQRIGHVVHTLEEVHRTLQSQLKEDATASSQGGEASLGPEWVAMMAKGYTMHAERQVLSAHTTDRVPDTGELGDNVELF